MSTCGSSAAAKPSNARATSRDAEGAWTAATVRERLPGQAEPGRVAIIRPCAPYDPRRRTRSFPVGRSPSPVVRDHALSSELSLITLYRTHRMEMISTLTDMINANVRFSRTHDWRRRRADIFDPHRRQLNVKGLSQ